MEVRVCIESAVEIRTGPGTSYGRDASSPLIEGERVYVVEERQGWIRFRVTPRDEGWSGWVRRGVTILEGEYELAALRSKLERLQEVGFIKEVDLSGRDFYVDRPLWESAEDRVREKILTTLSEYSRLSGNTPLVEIKDACTGDTLAKYGLLGIRIS